MEITFCGHSCTGIFHCGVTPPLVSFITPDERDRDTASSAIRPEDMLISGVHQVYVADTPTMARSSRAAIGLVGMHVNTFPCIGMDRKRAGKALAGAIKASYLPDTRTTI